MEQDFSDAIDKFKNVLAAKDIDLSSLTGILGNKESEEKSSDSSSDSHNSSNNGFDFDFDIETIIKLKNILSSAKNQNSPRLKLLEDLKPFLSPEAQTKLDELIKFVKILTLLEVFKENNIDLGKLLSL